MALSDGSLHKTGVLRSKHSRHILAQEIHHDPATANLLPARVEELEKENVMDDKENWKRSISVLLLPHCYFILILLLLTSYLSLYPSGKIAFSLTCSAEKVKAPGIFSPSRSFRLPCRVGRNPTKRYFSSVSFCRERV